MITNIQNIFLNWDIGQVEEINKVNSSTAKVHSINCKDGKTYFLKEKNNKDEVDKELQLHRVLLKHGIETSVPLLTLQNKYYIEKNEKLYCLYKALNGRTFEEHFDENAQNRAFLYGTAIAFLHSGLKESNLDVLFPAMNLKEQLENWAFPTALKIEDKPNNMMHSIISELNQKFLPKIDNLPIQIIHRDAHPGNILVKDNRLAGFIDFDITTRGIRLFDLCYCSTSILMSMFNDFSCREMWPKLLRELVKGYVSITPLNRIEQKSIIYVIFSIQLIFASYFYDLDNKDVAKLNLDALYWIYENKQSIQVEISTLSHI